MQELNDLLYVLLVPVLAMMFVQLRWLVQTRRRDRVLFRICQVRSDLLAYVVQEWEAGRLARNDYLYARVLLSSLNTTVSLYKHHHARMFNLGEFLRMLARYAASAKRIMLVKRTENPAIRAIEQRANEAMFHGFIAYTPFLASKIAGRILVAAMAFLARLGSTWFAKRVVRTREWYDVIRKQASSLATPPSVRVA